MLTALETKVEPKSEDYFKDDFPFQQDCFQF